MTGAPRLPPSPHHDMELLVVRSKEPVENGRVCRMRSTSELPPRPLQSLHHAHWWERSLFLDFSMFLGRRIPLRKLTSKWKWFKTTNSLVVLFFSGQATQFHASSSLARTTEPLEVKNDRPCHVNMHSMIADFMPHHYHP